MSIVNLDHFGGSFYQDRRYVLVGGCFDPLHEGHLEYFRQAKCFGPLVCALAPDAEIAQKRTPFLPDLTRVKVLDHCDLLDHVHLAVHGIVPVLEELRPIAYCKGEDWRGRLPLEQVDACDRLGIPIHYLPSVEASSTELLHAYQRRLNATKLAAFEQFVRSQTPAEKLWEPVTDYSRDTRRAIETPQADIIAEVFKGCSVLDYGCGFGYLVELLKERGMRAVGWDPQRTCEGLMEFRDLVVCREVLEHIPAIEIAATVQELVQRAHRYVYITTRFTRGSHLLDVDGSDDLDPTHITMLNQDYLRSLFVLEGCRRREDLERKLDWKNLGRVLVYEVPA